MKPTRDQGDIRQWAAKYNASPAEMRKLKFDGEPSTLYFLFGEARGGTPDLLPISWEDFFARFDLLGLSIVLDDSPQFEIVRVEKGKAAPVELAN